MKFYKAIALAAVLVLLTLCQAAIGSEYYNVSNTPFATISNGPQNAVIVDVTDPGNSAEVDAAVANALSSRVRTRSATESLSRQITKLREVGMIRPDVDPALYMNVLVRSNGSLDTPTRATQTYGGGTITFTYSGWSAADEALLKSFVSVAYPILLQVYGSPARTITVQVKNDTNQSEKDSLLGGVYVTGSGVQPQIILYRYTSTVSLERSFLHMMIRAFHDTAAFDYDAWEEGFDRAAAVVAGEAIDKKTENSATLYPLDLKEDAFYYMMSRYELLNQPALSNNTFFTSWANALQGGGDFYGMIIPRLGMSSTAWLKAYIERLRTDGQSFFNLFNAKYYQQLSIGADISGNVPELKSIASSITSTVESEPFDDWFEKQYVFDTSISIGKKLYVYLYYIDTPSDPSTEGYSFPTFLNYYATTASGDETPLAGTVYPVYLNYSYTDEIFLSSQYEQVLITNGEGQVDPTFYIDNITGGTQRVAADYTIGTETNRIYLPIGMAGTQTVPNTFLGNIIGGDSGSITVKVDAAATGVTKSIVNGAFGTSTSPKVLGFSRLTIIYKKSDNTSITKTVNVGPGPYVAQIYADSSGMTLTHTFTAGTRMISLPMSTYAQDQAEALQGSNGSPAIPANSLLLARWNPLLTDTYKYEMYPETPPFAPGRGYWAKFPSSVTVTISGEVPDPAGYYRIGLSNGWNQIGSPFTQSVLISDITVESGNDEPITFSEAWSSGLIGKTIWKYTPGTGYTEATSLSPWEGYWIKCNATDGAVLIVPGPGRSRSISRATSVAASTGAGRSLSPTKDWAIKLSARSDDGDTSKVTLGVATGATDSFDNAYDSEAPPSFGDNVSLTAQTASGTSCAIDTRAAGTSKVSWDILVKPSGANQDVTIKWNDILDAPKQYRLTLTDQSTGRSRYMRTTSSYKFNSGDGSARRFTITADSSTSSKLMISNLIVGAVRGSSVSFSYNLSTDAQVTAEIVSSGKLVRRLGSGLVTRSGINSMSWDKRDYKGEPVPAGAYMLQMTAVTEDGELVKTVRPVIIAR